MKDTYSELVMLFERLHRLFLEILKHELDKLSIKNLSNVQALILYNIGEEQVTVGEISNRGYYLGSNVSYNLKRMISNGYVKQQLSPNDRRSFYISLTKSGKDLLKKLNVVLEGHVSDLAKNNLQEKDLKTMLSQAKVLESFWSHLLLHNTRFF